jgi:hypothetical protein
MVTRRSEYWFERDPAWVPSLDDVAISRSMFIRAGHLPRFEQLEIYAARVLNASSVGSHTSTFH